MTLSLNCENCGSPLAVADDATSVSCGHCGSPLAVRRTGAAAFTQRIGDIEARTGLVVERVAGLRRREQTFAKLEKAWESVQKQYGVRYGGGRWHPPVQVSNRMWKLHALSLGGVFATVFGFGGFYLAIEGQPQALLVSIPVTLAIVAMFSFIYFACRREERASAERVRKYENARDEYLQRREMLLAEESAPRPSAEDRPTAADSLPQAAAGALTEGRDALKLISLGCRNCGVPLEVPDGARFVTCMHCGTQLAVRHSGSAAYTEKLDALDRRTETIGQQVDEFDRDSAVVELDREWKRELEQYGNPHTDQTAAGCIIAFGLLFATPPMLPTVAILMIDNGQPASSRALSALGMMLFALPGLGFAGFGSYCLMKARRRFAAYRLAKKRYEGRRAELSGGLTDEQAVWAGLDRLAERSGPET